MDVTTVAQVLKEAADAATAAKAITKITDVGTRCRAPIDRASVELLAPRLLGAAKHAETCIADAVHLYPRKSVTYTFDLRGVARTLILAQGTLQPNTELVVFNCYYSL